MFEVFVWENGKFSFKIACIACLSDTFLIYFRSFAALDRLEAVGLSDNRLTAMSLPTIIENLNPYSVKFVDLSFNEMFDKGAKALANVFKANGNVLRYLDLCNTGIRCEDVKVICNNLKVLPNFLDELYLAGNRIAADGAVGKVFTIKVVLLC